MRGRGRSRSTRGSQGEWSPGPTKRGATRFVATKRSSRGVDTTPAWSATRTRGARARLHARPTQRIATHASSTTSHRSGRAAKSVTDAFSTFVELVFVTKRRGFPRARSHTRQIKSQRFWNHPPARARAPIDARVSPETTDEASRASSVNTMVESLWKTLEAHEVLNGSSYYTYISSKNPN
jgi:hypothetical protein